MKKYTIQFTLYGDGDEFWESNTTPREVLQDMYQTLEQRCTMFEDLKIIKIVDEEEYDLDSGEHEDIE